MAISKSTVETWDEDRLRWIKMHRKNDKINHTEKKEEENTLWRARIEVTLIESPYWSVRARSAGELFFTVKFCSLAGAKPASEL